MANGDSQTGFDEASQVLPSSMRSDRKEVVGTLLGGQPGGAMEQMLQKHHDQRMEEARFWKGHLVTSQAALEHIARGLDPETGEALDPSRKDELLSRYGNAHTMARQNLEKALGPANKGVKQGLQKLWAVLDHRQQAAGQPQQPQPSAAAATTSAPSTSIPQSVDVVNKTATMPGGRVINNPGGPLTTTGQQPTPPPAPLDAAPPKAQGRGTAAAPSTSGQAEDDTILTLPLLRKRMEAEELTQRDIHRERAFTAARREIADEWVKEGWLDAKSPAYRDFVMFGKPPTSAESRGATTKYQKGGWVTDPTDGLPRQTVFDPVSGQNVFAHNHEPVPDGATPISPADWSLKTINIMTPDGPRILFRKLGPDGKEHAFDLQSHEFAGDLIPYSPRMLNRETDREVQVYDATGHMQKMILRSTTKVNYPGSSPMGGAPPEAPTRKPTAPPAPSGEPAPKKATGPSPSQGPKKAAPKAAEDTGDGNESLYAGTEKSPGLFSAGQLDKNRNADVSSTQVRNAMIGDHAGEGNVGGLAKSLNIFDDPEQTQNISEYLKLAETVIEQGGEMHASGEYGGALGALSWGLGIPQATIGFQQQALIDAYNKISERDRQNGNSDGTDFLNNWYRAIGTVSGMRAFASGTTGYRWSVNMLRAELPRPGMADDKGKAIDKIMNIIRESNILSKRYPMVRRLDETKVRKAIERGTATTSSKPSTSGGTHSFTYNGTRYENVPDDLYKKYKDKPGFKE